jgi:FAD/FMN-containing dehydrogenase
MAFATSPHDKLNEADRTTGQPVAEQEIRAAASTLRELLDPSRVLISGPAYDDARRVWNGAVEHRPALVVQPVNPSEIQAALGVARTHRLPMSVRGGGHDWAGRAVRHGGLVMDLSRLRRVTVDPEARVATVSGGATAADVIAAADRYGLSAATGTVGAVGMAGLTLGGGYGPLNGQFGLALDNLLSADVVLADGRLVTADANHEPELFWALRGGGGNFGVVTSMRIELHPVHQVLAGLIIYPWLHAADVLSRLSDMLGAAPDELTVQVAVLSGPDGSPVLVLSPAWSGDLTQGAQAVDELHRLGTPLHSQVAPMSYADMLSLFDPYIANGRHYAIRTRSVAGFTPDVIAALVEAGSTRTSPLTGISIHHFHGAATRVPLETTAFGIRQYHHLVEIVAGWEPADGDDGARHRTWADQVSASLAPSALPGGYPNLLGPDAHDQIAHAYGVNAPRLRAAKRRFDPDGIFSAIALPADASL